MPEIKKSDIFATPLLSTHLPEIDNDLLARTIYSLRDAGLMMCGKGIGGLQTQANFLRIDRPVVRQLHEAFIGMVQFAVKGKYPILQTLAWANIGRRGDKSLDIPHNHLPYHYSAVYFVQIPQMRNEHEGCLVFSDPRDEFNESELIPLQPRPGYMVLFPSWLKHTVVPCMESETDRITISLNAIIGISIEANQLAPHRAKKRPEGTILPLEADPNAPQEFPYPE